MIVTDATLMGGYDTAYWERQIRLQDESDAAMEAEAARFELNPNQARRDQVANMTGGLSLRAEQHYFVPVVPS